MSMNEEEKDLENMPIQTNVSALNVSVAGNSMFKL